MRPSPPFWLSLPGRFVACASLFVALPLLVLVALLIHLTSGSPVFRIDEVPGTDGAARGRCLRFRTTGPGSPFFHTIGKWVRACSIDVCPGFWSVANGDIRLRDFLKMR